MLRRKNQRGAAMITLGLWMTAFMGFAALAIDIARVSFTGNEVQTMADVAATATATSLAKGSTVAQAKADAQAMLAMNRVDGSTATIGAQDIEVGSYDYTTHTFTPGGTPSSAARATERKTVPNIMAGILGSPSSTVAKVAVAGFHGTSEAMPTFPLALGDCYLPSMLNCFGQTGVPCQSFAQIPTNAQNSAWTGFFRGSAAGDVSYYLPIQPANPRCVPNTATYPTLKVGDIIQLNNGALSSVIGNMNQCASDYAGKTWLMPVVECNGNFSGGHKVTGFATFSVDAINKNQGQATGSINISTTFKLLNGPAGGCATCGTGKTMLLD